MMGQNSNEQTFADLLRGMTDEQFERFRQAVADDLAKPEQSKYPHRM